MRNRYSILAIALLMCFLDIKGVGYYFYVQLKDKNNTPYSLSAPSAYLSQRALERRTFFQIAIDSTDLPVNQSYISQIEATNVKVHCTSKWINGVTVTTSDSSLITAVQNLNFVKFVQFTGKTGISGSLISRQKFPHETVNTDYGQAVTQINQLNGAVLHNNGYRGEGMQIAVIDAGFYNVDINAGFDSLRNEGRLLGTKDFVNPQSNIYAENSHGANVLSTMAGNIKDTYVGTAPKASYWLIRSEAANTENLCEPDFWISAIEFADSAGVDISTTSLGYTEFDNPAMNFSYADMNGTTVRASIAASMAAAKGIMVLNSAGNEGNKPWHYIGVPADAQHIIAVGAVTSTGTAGAFSSFGPSSDGRVKPELCALGAPSALIGVGGTVSYGNGTSYSCPILAGMTACFLQAVKAKKPSLSLNDIREMMYRSANLYDSPTTQMGYGIPNFQTAYTQLTNLATKNQSNDIEISVYHDIKQNQLNIRVGKSINNNLSLKLYNTAGTLIKSVQINTNNFRIDTQLMPQGVYILNINNGISTANKRVIL